MHAGEQQFQIREMSILTLMKDIMRSFWGKGGKSSKQTDEGLCAAIFSFLLAALSCRIIQALKTESEGSGSKIEFVFS